MNKNNAAKQKPRRHFLLLQGTNSFFFNLLASKIRDFGFKTTKINFNAGDKFFYTDSNSIDYKYSLDDWASYITDISKMQGVTDLIVYDDTKPVHALAIEALKEIGINIHVFAPAYFDQNHITLEQGGTNGKSFLAHEPMFYMRTPTIHSDTKPQPIPTSAAKQLFYNIAYFVTNKLGDGAKFNTTKFGFSTSYFADLLKEKALASALAKKKYFLATISANNSAFIRKTIASFAAHTHKSILIINVNGAADFSKAKKAAKKSMKKHSVNKRVFLLKNANLSKLVKKSEGMIVFDSIDGIVALENEKPLITLGKTIFSFAGLTNQSKLLGFWHRRTSPNPSLYGKFKNHVSARTQINGSFFSRKGMEMAATSACRNIIYNHDFGVGNNVSENV